MAKATRKKSAKPEDSSNLLQAVNFCLGAVKELGEVYQTHLILAHNWAVGFDGVLTAAHPITDDLTAYPHGDTLATALKRCATGTAITQGDDRTLKVSAGRLRASVPCAEPFPFPPPPDAPALDLEPDQSAALKRSLSEAGRPAKDQADRTLFASVMLQSGTASGTDGIIVIESWHGLTIPGQLMIPKVFVKTLEKTDKTIAKIGGSDNSLTVYFTDKSWLKTQLYRETFPDLGRLWEQVNADDVVPIPDHFFPGVDHLKAFADGRIEITASGMRNEKAEFDLDIKMPYERAILSSTHLLMLNGIVSKYRLDPKASYFSGENCRALLSGIYAH